MKTLIVVDMQKDFIDGALGTKEAVAIVPMVKKKIEESRKNHNQIIFTRDTHQGNYLSTQEGKNLPVEHCIEGTPGWQIFEELEVEDMDIIINKVTFGNNWAKTVAENEALFQGEEIELVGLCTDICVISNALGLKAIFPEKLISVDSRCCAGVTPKSHQNALDAMKMCQINVFPQ